MACPRAGPGVAPPSPSPSLARRLLGTYQEGLSALDGRARRVVLGSFLFVAARMSVMTFLGVYLHEARGIDLALVGVAFLVENVCRGLAGPFAGALSDRIGRKPVLLGSVLATGLLVPGFLLVRDPASLFAWSVALGLAQGPYFPTVGALLLDRVSYERRQEALAVNYTAISLGYTVGVAPAGFLAERSFLLLGLASGLTFLLIGLLLALALRGPLPLPVQASGAAADGGARSAARGVAWNAVQAARDPAFLTFAAPAILFPLGIGLVSLVLPVHAADLGIATGTVGLLLGGTGLLLAVLSIPLNVGVRTPFRLLPLASLLCAASYLAFAYATGAAGLLLGLTLFTVGEVLFSAALPTAVAALAPAGSRGAYQGAWGFLMAIGLGSAFFLAGLLRPALGWSGAWLAFLAAALLGGSALLGLRAWFRRVADARAADPP